MNPRLDVEAVDVLLCDADGNLFPSKEPAFVASSAVTNRLLADLGVERRYTATELRRGTTGKNFRTTAVELARATAWRSSRRSSSGGSPRRSVA